jgi:hypothetical protein
MATKITRIAVGETEWKVWVLDDDGSAWSLAASTGAAALDWVKDTVGNHITQFAVDGTGNLWTTNTSGMVHIRKAGRGVASKGEWEAKPPLNNEKALGIAAGKSEVMMVNELSRVRRWDSSASKWVEDRVAANVTDICSGGQGVAYCINTDGKIYKAKPGDWDGPTATVGGVKRLEVGFDNALAYLGSDSHVYHLTGNKRDDVGAGVDLAVRNLNDLWVVNSAGEIWRRTSTPFTSPLIVGATAAVTVDGKGYTWAHIKGPKF